MERLKFDVEFICSHIFRNISHFNQCLLLRNTSTFKESVQFSCKIKLCWKGHVLSKRHYPTSCQCWILLDSVVPNMFQHVSISTLLCPICFAQGCPLGTHPGEPILGIICFYVWMWLASFGEN